MVGADEDFVMVGLKLLCDQARIGKLAKNFPIAFEANGISFDRLAQKLAHQRYDRAGVEPAAEKRAEWHIADQMQFDALAE